LRLRERIFPTKAKEETVAVKIDVRSALETVGLDPAVGFLHRDRLDRYSLVPDMIEEFRPFIADCLTLSSVICVRWSEAETKLLSPGKSYLDRRLFAALSARR
jgi:hypothetical protein